MTHNDFFTSLQQNLIKIAEDAKTIEEKRLKTDEDLVEKAHPKPEYIADAQGDGGLVENQNEQHQKMQEVVNKMPTGNYINLYASIASELVKIADQCDEAGDTEAADIITSAVEDLLPLA